VSHNIQYILLCSIFQASSGKKAARCRSRLESDASVQSLPADLERVASVCENELLSETSSKSGFRGSVDSTLSTGSDEAFLGPSASAAQNADAVPKSVTDGDFSCNSRESSFDGSDSWRSQIQGEHQKVSLSGGIDLQRFAMQQRTRATSSDSAEQRNRTMLIQVGQNELSLISLDRKTIIFERHFKDISFCSQVTEC